MVGTSRKTAGGEKIRRFEVFTNFVVIRHMHAPSTFLSFSKFLFFGLLYPSLFSTLIVVQLGLPHKFHSILCIIRSIYQFLDMLIQ